MKFDNVIFENEKDCLTHCEELENKETLLFCPIYKDWCRSDCVCFEKAKPKLFDYGKEDNDAWAIYYYGCTAFESIPEIPKDIFVSN